MPTDIPVGIPHGYVSGKFRLVTKDGPDAGNLPDSLPLSGVVEARWLGRGDPLNANRRLVEGDTLYILRDYVQPDAISVTNGVMETVALVSGWWAFSVILDGAERWDVPALIPAGTVDNPTNLAVMQSVVPPESVNTEFIAVMQDLEAQLAGKIGRNVSVADGTSGLTLDQTGNSGGHGLSVIQRSTAQVSATALNITSLNAAESCVWISGRETNRGTLKIRHDGTPYTSGEDANAAALSVDIAGPGSKARGAYFWRGDVTVDGDSALGDAFCYRRAAGATNPGKDAFVVKSDGRTGINLPFTARPYGQLEVQGGPADPAVVIKASLANPGLVCQGGTTGHIASFRTAEGLERVRWAADGAQVAYRPIFATGGLTIGGTSVKTGGNEEALGLTDAPSDGSAVTGGGALVSRGGNLKWRTGITHVVGVWEEGTGQSELPVASTLPTGTVRAGHASLFVHGTDLYVRVGSTSYKLTATAV